MHDLWDTGNDPLRNDSPPPMDVDELHVCLSFASSGPIFNHKILSDYRALFP